MYCGYLVSSVLPTAGLEVSQHGWGAVYSTDDAVTIRSTGERPLAARRRVVLRSWVTAAYRLSR
jgi:hypothetical protein